jgi:acyl dehydratase
VYIGDTVEYTVTVKRIIKPLGSVSLELKASKTNVNETCVLGKAVCIFVNKGDKE